MDVLSEVYEVRDATYYKHLRRREALVEERRGLLEGLTSFLARPTQGDMLVRKLGDVAYGLYATPSYIQRFGTVPISGDLSGHQIVGFSPDDRPLGPVWWLSRAERNARVVMRSSNAAVRLGTVLADEALAALPCFEADQLAGVERVAGPELIGGLELWLLTRSDLAQLGHVRAVMDFLVAEIKARIGELSGR